MGKRYDGKIIVFNTAFLLNIVAWCLTFIAFGSPYWVVSWPRVHNDIKLVGLWQICFSGLILHFDENQFAYHGCWWVLAPRYKNIRAWMMPWWFIITQVFYTIIFVGEFIVLCAMLHLKRRKEKCNPTIRIILIQSATGFTIATAIVNPIIMVLFGCMAYLDTIWMPNRQLNYLSWSYGLAVVSGFLSLFAAIALVVYTRIVRREYRDPARSIEMQKSLKT